MPNRKAPEPLRLRRRALAAAGGSYEEGSAGKSAAGASGTTAAAASNASPPATSGHGGLYPALTATRWAAGLLFLVLLWAWIKPIAMLSGWRTPDKLGPLLLAMGICVLLDMANMSVWKSVPLKGLAAWLAVGWIFRGSAGEEAFPVGWFRQYGAVLVQDTEAFLAGNAGAISGEHRTLIFLAGWMVLAGVVQALLLHSRRALWLLAVTWTYLAGLQLWPGVDTTGELIASGMAGLALLAMLNLDRIGAAGKPELTRTPPANRPASAAPAAPMNTDSPSAPPANPTHVSPAAGESQAISSPGSPVRIAYDRKGRTFVPPWAYGLALTLTLVLFLAAWAGSGGQKGPLRPLDMGDFSKWGQSLLSLWSSDGEDSPSARAVFAGGGGVTGYSSGDYRLGGPLTVRDEPVFTARSPVSTYWRGESKDYYDGTGWSSRSGGSAEMTDGQMAAPSAQTITQELLYSGRQDMNLLFAGGRIEQVEALYTADGSQAPAGSLALDAPSGRYDFRASSGKQLGYARYKARLNEYPEAALMNAVGEIPPGVAAAYLQLPDKLPERVRELALAVSAAGTTPYAKAALLQAYLREHYRYSLMDVAVPANGQDFTDAFLFGSAGGYCDYFSTSLAVMLRASGVPARWVKGFGPGEVTPDETGAVQTIAVSTRNAHSWVELYLPGLGWVAMDPTPGFAGFQPGGTTASPEQALALHGGSETKSATGSVRRMLDRWDNSYREFKQAAGEQLSHWSAHTAEALRKHRFTAALLAAAAAPLLYGVLRRRHLLRLMLSLRFRPRGRKGGEMGQRLLDRLWQRVFRLYGPPLPGQTLREYAAETGRRWPGKAEALYELTELSEKMHFSPEGPAWISGRKLERLWRTFFGPSLVSSPGKLPASGPAGMEPPVSH